MPAMRTSDIAALITTKIDQKLVSTLEKNFILADLGEPRMLNKNQGHTVQVQYWNNPTASTLPSDEAAGASENSLSFTTAAVTVNFYSNDFAFTEFAEAIDVSGSIETGYVGRAVYNINETVDTLVRDVVDGGTTTRLTNARSTPASFVSTDTINVYELNFMTGGLENNNVQPHPKDPGGGYCGVFHTQQVSDLRADTGGSSNPNVATWYDVMRRNDASAFANGTVGRIMNITIKKSTNIQRIATGGSGSDVIYYTSFVFGKEAFMVSSINGLAQPGGRGGRPLVKIIPAEMNHATPLGNKHRVVWKMYFGVGIIDSTRFYVYQSASGA